MTGKSVFENLMREMISNPPNIYSNQRITEEQYAEWQKLASWDIMQGLRYGQSFCRHFGITDNILYYEFSWLHAEDYIRKTYLDRTI